MRVLLIGGTGNLSSACTGEALKQGHEIYLYNRGNSPSEFGEKVITITGDTYNSADREKIKKYAPYDVVVNFMCFTETQMQADIDLFASITQQYIFISSATVYLKPSPHYIITEETPLGNPFSEYAQNKIDCELTLRKQSKLAYTIIRPSYTFGKNWIPAQFSARVYNPIYRLRKGLPYLSAGDGEALWVLTHNTDLASAIVGLFQNSKAINTHFHITSDEVHTWDQITRIKGSIVGAEPHFVHISSDFLGSINPGWIASLLGDKARTAVFDNSKIKDAVPGWSAKRSLESGLRESIAWYEERTERMIPDAKLEEEINYALQKYGHSMK